MIEVLHDYWFLIVACFSVVGWMIVQSVRIGGLYQRFSSLEASHAKIGNGVEAKRMAEHHDEKLNSISTLCTQRGEQMVRMDTVIINLNKTMDRFEQKLDKLSYAINKLVQDE